jgi:CheY-like chemotaxis protein
LADGSRTALVVEDDPKSAALIRVQLEQEGFTVVHALTAEEGLVLARRQPISLITLDIMLPDMDGWDFLALLKETAELRRIPVVIVSIVADATKGFALGAAAVMQKPVSRQQLVAALADLGMVPLPDGESLSILIVDDDPASIDLIAEGVLEVADTVLSASGGQEAIEIARRELPDAIILDLLMPDVNGFDVVVALNERPETARIPILIITAMQVSAADRERLNGYVTAIMEKGDVGPGQLTDQIRRAMAGRELVA